MFSCRHISIAWHSISALCSSPDVQVGTLSNLRQLFFVASSVSASGFAPLSGLTGLQRLALHSCKYLPACLPQLSGLEELSMGEAFPGEPWMDDYDSVAAVLDAAWPKLVNQLRCLVLEAHFIHSCVPVSVLTACSRLQALCLLPGGSGRVGALSPGPTLPGLRSLAGPVEMLVASLPVLQAATQLEYVGAAAWQECELTSLPELLAWAAQHPTLRRLTLEGRAAGPLVAYSHHIAEARQRNANLCITSHYNLEAPTARLLFDWGFSYF